jgi:hypothetical protein
VRAPRRELSELPFTRFENIFIPNPVNCLQDFRSIAAPGYLESV